MKIKKNIFFICVLCLTLNPMYTYAASQSLNLEIATPSSTEENDTKSLSTHDIYGTIAQEVTNTESEPVYSAPENTNHVNVSFRFSQPVGVTESTKLVYPITMKIVETDTGDKYTLTIKSEGQILEVPQGDYIIRTLKDSQRIPLAVPRQVLRLYNNTEYNIQYEINYVKKLFMNFITDNILLLAFILVGAWFYKRIVVQRFSTLRR